MSGAPRRIVTAKAFAKINVGLRVLDRRPDGYHELRTTFQSLALHDTIVCERSSGPSAIVSNDPMCPADASNIVWTAAQTLWRESRGRMRMPSLRIRIVKRIPVQAGLGGGSSDAVATMRALAALWRVKVTDDTLVRLGRTLGADVPFFVIGGTALGVERGDVLFPLQDMPRMWVVLVFPGFGVSTKEAFAWHDEMATTMPVSRGNNRALASLFPPSELVNDLERPVSARRQAIARFRLALSKAGARHAAMSGSGSTVFGLFDHRRAAVDAASSLASRRVRTVLTHTTSASEYRADVRARLGQP